MPQGRWARAQSSGKCQPGGVGRGAPGFPGVRSPLLQQLNKPDLGHRDRGALASHLSSFRPVHTAPAGKRVQGRGAEGQAVRRRSPATNSMEGLPRGLLKACRAHSQPRKAGPAAWVVVGLVCVQKRQVLIAPTVYRAPAESRGLASHCWLPTAPSSSRRPETALQGPFQTASSHGVLSART